METELVSAARLRRSLRRRVNLRQFQFVNFNFLTEALLHIC